jgi:transposase
MSESILSSSQRRQLRRRLHQTTDAHLDRRTLARLEYDRGQSPTHLAQLLGVSRQSIYNWMDRWQAHPHSTHLADAMRSGRPRLWTENVDRILGGLLQETPQSLGYFHTQWTIPTLQNQLNLIVGHLFSVSTIRRQLTRLGYVWKRPRYFLNPDPFRAKKNASSSENCGIWDREVSS